MFLINTQNMGFDIHVHLFGGFKIPLSEAFDSNILSSKIMDEDGYQLIEDDKYKSDIINEHVLSEDLKNVLLDERNDWNIYIVTSSQYDFDFERSYFILCDSHQDLINGRIPDYQVGSVTDVAYDCNTTPQIWEIITNIPLKTKTWKYNIHWVIESSY